jgi:uncharacterized sulfatase
MTSYHNVPAHEGRQTMRQTLPRRQFLKGVAGGAASLALARVCRGQAAANVQRPNILFCLADDLSWIHTGAMGDRVVKTPAFDRVAREGVLFTNAYTVSPSCSASRACILTGQHMWRLREGAVLWGTLPREFDVYPDLLEAGGYHVGFSGKGWGPGQFQPGGRQRNPAGPAYKSFADFHKTLPPGKPFCFWFGSHDPHRPYEKGSGAKSGMNIADVKVPPFLPDSQEVRSDILDYCFEVNRFDNDVGQIMKLLEGAGQLDNTLVVITSDNGMPFPRAKANLYDYGTHMPLAARWPARVKGGRVINDLISFVDFAPTFLEAAGLKAAPSMTGRSFWDLLISDRSGDVDPARHRVFLALERHAWVRDNGAGYPCRAVRTRDFLYIRNFEPDRWPAGNPGPGLYYDRIYGDIDPGPTKTYMLEHRDAEPVRRLFQLACARRPAEELYDLKNDPDQMANVAEAGEYAARKSELRGMLDAYLKETNDPRALGNEALWDGYPYYGAVPKAAATRTSR